MKEVMEKVVARMGPGKPPRDINRIDPITNLLNEIWKKQPDTRFTQLIHNFYAEMHHDDHQGVFCMHQQSMGNAYDLYNVEDDVFYRFLVRYNEKL